MGGVNIPLPELDVTKPAQAPYPDALAEFQRASQLQTAAAQRQQMSAQTQGLQQQNQAQGLALKDEMLRRQLAPQFVQKDDNGKITGFDNEGLYSAMLSQGADPLNIQKMRMGQVEMQKALLGLADAKLAHQEKINDTLHSGLESLRDLNNKTSKPQQTPPAPSIPAQPSAPQGPSMANPDLPYNPLAAASPSASPPANVGAAQPGSPASIGTPEPGAAPTASESAAVQAQSAPKSISNETQLAYQRLLMNWAGQGIPISKFKPVLSSEADLDQAEAELGLHKQALADAKELAATQESAGKGAQAQAEATKADNIPFPEMGVVYHPSTGAVTSVTGGQAMSPAMLESKYVMNQAAKQRTGQSPDPQFDAGFEKFKTLVPTANINLQSGLLNDQARQMAAQNYEQTGALPQGMRSPAMAAGILNQAASGAQGIPNIAANKQSYEANTKSLESLQKNFDQVSAFENTAGKNLDLFLNKLSAIPDLGVKFANVPLRLIDDKMIGSDNYQAMKAAQQTASAEAAKVLSSSNASGVLSDSQKREAEDILSGNLSYSAAKQVVGTLKQDFANRHQSYADQIQAIKGRSTGSQPSTQSAPPKTSDFFSQFGGQAR